MLLLRERRKPFRARIVEKRAAARLQADIADLACGGNAMGLFRWAGAVTAGLLIACAVTQTGAASEPKAAVAPKGMLRAAFLLGPIYATKNGATGELSGMAIDLGQELARRIGVVFEPVSFASLPDLMAAAKADAWDIAFMGINSERAAVMDFSAPYMDVEQGYLARAGVPLAATSDVDKPGLRVGVLEKSGADVRLSRTLSSAVLMRAANVSELNDLLDAGQVDVIAATKTTLFAASKSRPGSRVLDGSILMEPIGIGVPKGRDVAAAAYVQKFVQDAKAEGLIKSAIARAGLRGVSVAAP